MKILIATPAHRRAVSIDLMWSIMTLDAAFRQSDIERELRFSIGAVGRSTNGYAGRP